jgi:hypothetical protein
MRHARDEHDEPLLLIKGGVAVEMPLGLRARATKDLDASVRPHRRGHRPAAAGSIGSRLGGITFRLTGSPCGQGVCVVRPKSTVLKLPLTERPLRHQAIGILSDRRFLAVARHRLR